jgi:hypothetical protein
MSADDILKRWQANRQGRSRTNEAIAKLYEGVDPYTEEELKEAESTPYQETLEQVDAKLRPLVDRVTQAKEEKP